ncbi:hypothetical protein ACFXKD_03380 [Nocardiopsis aegyptia]|uniref:hypothetical protein n=1 Tax=Nocardiopsis aegyptia TaxID=220378 RepID=UPI00366B31B2
MTAVSEDVQKFVKACVALTGFSEFDLHATGMGRLYLDTARQQVGGTRFDQFLRNLSAASTPLVDTSALGSTDLEIARAVTYLWYTGAWPRLALDAHVALRREIANTEFVVAPSSYVEGLVWRTFHGHPTGAKPPGFATWSMQPPPLPSLAEIGKECGLDRTYDAPTAGEEPAADEDPDLVELTQGRLPGPMVERGVHPSAVPAAGASRTEGDTP